jgi:hypothetical protein
MNCCGMHESGWALAAVYHLALAVLITVESTLLQSCSHLHTRDLYAGFKSQVCQVL